MPNFHGSRRSNSKLGKLVRSADSQTFAFHGRWSKSPAMKVRRLAALIGMAATVCILAVSAFGVTRSNPAFWPLLAVAIACEAFFLLRR